MGIKNHTVISTKIGLEMTRDMDVENGEVTVNGDTITVTVEDNSDNITKDLVFHKKDGEYTVIIAGDSGLMVVDDWAIEGPHNIYEVDIEDSYIAVMSSKVMMEIKEKIDNE